MPIYVWTFAGAIFLIIIIVILNILQEYRNVKLAKRFDNFSLKSYNEHESSFFDEFSKKLNNFIQKLSKILKKSHVLNDYSKHYEKYIEYSLKNQKECIDYVTIKFLLGFLFVILNIIAVVFKLKQINPISYLITFIIGFFVLDIALIINYNKKRHDVEGDLLKAIIIMNNSFKSGKNIIQAISTVKNELDGPIADEFKRIYLDITYGLSLEVVFERFYERIKLEDAKYIASSLTLLNKTGGNIVKVFSTIEKSFFNKKRMYDELNSLTSSSIFVYRILVFMPIAFTLIILILNPTYFNPLFNNPLGIILLLLILILYITYIITIKKVLKVKI